MEVLPIVFYNTPLCALLLRFVSMRIRQRKTQPHDYPCVGSFVSAQCRSYTAVTALLMRVIALSPRMWHRYHSQ